MNENRQLLKSLSTSRDANGLPADGESASEVLSCLRAATGDRHRAVDRCMPLSRPDLKLSDYVEHLYILRTWLQPLESWLDASAPPLASNLPRVHQTEWIDADLMEAGLPYDRAQATVMNIWPADATAPYQWGARYVVEGSRLGAAVLYRRLSHRLHPHKLRYLRGEDGRSPDSWPRFLRELRASVQTPADIRDACKGACASFDALVANCPAVREPP